MRNRLAVALSLALAWPLGAVELISRNVWEADVPGFGGYSALEMDSSGTRFWTVSDKGHLRAGRFRRDDAGRIIGISAGPAIPLRDRKGDVLTGWLRDAEGLALMPDGRLCISFEGLHRVACYAATGGASDPTIRPPEFREMQSNSSLEALAVRDQTLFAIPERSGLQSRPFPVFRYRETWEKAFDLPRRGTFLVAGADIGPDGRLYLLERDFSVFGGFQTRVRRFEMAEDGLSGEETVLITRMGQFDNLEGINVWQSPTGLRMTLISDDNFRSFQQTEIVEFALD